MNKRLCFQFILCNLLLLICWHGIKTHELNENNRSIEVQEETQQAVKAETIDVDTNDVFSRQRIVEYSELQQTRIFLSDDEYEILLRIVEAEAGGEDEIGRMLVASVVLNRRKHEMFPDSIKEVVYQKSNGTYQFSPVKTGRLTRARVSEETIEAVEKVLSGIDYSEGALFFASRKAADPAKMLWFDRNLVRLLIHGGHEFFGL